MKLTEFYKKYNLNRSYMAELAHVGAKTIMKYENDIPIRESSKERIEKFIKFTEDNNLARPKCPWAAHYDYWYGRQWDEKVREYKKFIEKNMK